VPLADVPATGDSLPIWGLAAILSGAALIPLTLLGKKRREDEV
jgi:LPXTG-motif cell wall-anchored protein